MPRRILSISTNYGLLVTRNDLLAVAGYSVASPRHPEDAPLLFSKDKFDAVLIGDSIPSQQRRRVIEELREQDEHVPIIYVYADVTQSREPSADACVDVTGDPEPLLKSIESLIKNRFGRAA